MSTVLIFGLGELGGWALEFLARSEGVDRIVTVRRSESAPHRSSLAAIGSVFQDSLVCCESVTADLINVETTAELIQAVDPEVILTSATVQSPRRLAAADIEAPTRAILRRATFGMWLPWHLLPVTRLMEAVIAACSRAPVVNLAFPDVVNPAVWKRLGRGPAAGGGNGEISAAILRHFVASTREVPLADVEVAVVGSHAFFTHGPQVPHSARAWVMGEEITHSLDTSEVFTTHPEPIDWTRAPNFSVFGASAAKNVVALLAEIPRRAHVNAPNGLPGTYPVDISAGGIELALPAGMEIEEAIAINEAGNAYDGIERIEDDGTVVFTTETTAAMRELGYEGARVGFDELDDRVFELEGLYDRITR